MTPLRSLLVSLFRAFLILTLLGSTDAFATPAAATEVHFLHVKLNATALKLICDANGGEFSYGNDQVGVCTRRNCDGQGGVCQVSCDPGLPCTGTTPFQPLGMTVADMLGAANGNVADFGDPGGFHYGSNKHGVKAIFANTAHGPGINNSTSLSLGD